MILSSLGIGLLSSATHCAGMCGPIHMLLKRSEVSTTWYHSGRITGYMAQGVVWALVGATLFSHGSSSPLHEFLPQYAWMVPVVLGLIYLVLSLEFLGVPLKLEARLQRFFPHKALQSYLKSPKRMGLFAGGMVASLLPCPSTLAALSLTLAAGTNWLDASLMGAALMGVFGLGTLPSFAVISLRPIQKFLNHTRVLRIALGLYFVVISGRQWYNLYLMVSGHASEASCH